jgi:glycerophosphoryl diester phosphodiesterase
MRATRNGLTTALLAVMLLLLPVAAASAHGGGAREQSALVIGHRGAAGYLPDHTLQGYALAMKLGADYIEPDLVATKDGHLIARHEPNITGTTDVASHPEFAGRRTTKVVDGVAETGFFASDFTLAEIKTLRAVQPLSERPQQFNGRFEIPTFGEVIALAKRKSRQLHRRIGVYPETKHPTYHKGLGLPLERRLVKALRRAGWNRRRAPVFISPSSSPTSSSSTGSHPCASCSSWTPTTSPRTGRSPTRRPSTAPTTGPSRADPELQGRTFGFFTTDEGLEEIGTYADGIGPWKPYIASSRAIALNPDGTVADANGDGLVNETDRELLPGSRARSPDPAAPAGLPGRPFPSIRPRQSTSSRGPARPRSSAATAASQEGVQRAGPIASVPGSPVAHDAKQARSRISSTR